MLVGFEASALRGQKSGVGYYTENMIANVIASAPQDRFVLFSNRDVKSGVRSREGNAFAGHDGQSRITGAFPETPGLEYDHNHFPVRALWMQTVLPRAIRTARPDVCHFTNYLAPVNCPSPFVVTIYDMTVFITPRYHTFKKLVLDRTLIPVVSRRASAIITVSNSARNDIVKYLKVPREKVRVITGAASPRFQPITAKAHLDEVRRRYNLNSPYILYVGTLEPRKNLVRLVRAFGRLRDRGCNLKLVLVGQPGWQVEPLYAEIERLGLQRDVVFCGYVPAGDLPALYTMAECMAFPSLYEGFGLPVLEAMACGTPVVTSRSSSLAEVASDAALLVDPLSVSELEEALHMIHSNGSLRADLRGRGLGRASLFSWEATANATLSTYRQVHAQAGGLPGQASKQLHSRDATLGDW